MILGEERGLDTGESGLSPGGRRATQRRDARPALALPWRAMSGRHLLFFAVCTAALGSARPVRAEDEAKAQGSDDEATDVVARGDAALGFQSRASMRDARREVTDAASLLEPLPGVHVRRLGGDDGFATLSVRGSSSNQVAVVLAGVPLTGGGDPTIDLSTLPLWPGARARVYRSFAPATLGPGSLGGTLVLDPPSPHAELGTEVWAAAGSFGAARMRVGDVRAVGAHDEGRVVTGLSASRSDGNFSYYDDKGALVRQDNAQHAGVNGLVAYSRPVHWSRGGEGSLTVTSLAQTRGQHLPGSISFPTPGEYVVSTRLLESLELRGPLAEGAWSVRGWGRRETYDLHAGHGSDTLGFAESDTTITAFGSSLGWRGRPHEALILDARVEGAGERFAPQGIVGAAAAPGARRVSAAAGVDATLRLTGAWTIGASARGDVYDDTMLVATGDSHGEALPTGHLGTDVTLGHVTLSAHGGRVARPASFLERFGDRGNFLGNPGLVTESGVVVDAGARFAERFGPLGIELESVGFSSWDDDLIVFLANGASGRLKATNIGRARVLGLEESLGARLRGVFGGFADLHAAYTGLAATNESACASVVASAADCERPPLPGRPTHDVVTDLAYTYGPLRVRYGVDAVSGIRVDLTGAVEVPTRVLHSTGARLEVPHVRGLTLALDVRNLFDLRTGTYAGAVGPVERAIGDTYDYPLPGRSVLVSARFVTASDAR